MKHLLLCMMISFITLMQAQTEKGKVFFSAMTGSQFNVSTYESQFDEKFQTRTFSFSSGVGIFAAKNFGIGLNGNLATVTWEYLKGGSKYVSTYYTLSPTLHYFFPLKGNFRPFITGGVGLIRENNDGYIDKGRTLDIGSGFSCFITKNVAFNFTVNYASQRLWTDNNSVDKTKRTVLNSLIGFGVFL